MASNTVVRGGGGVVAGGRGNELSKLWSSCVFLLASFHLEFLVNALSQGWATVMIARASIFPH